jgi:hypothetical protein
LLLLLHLLLLLLLLMIILMLAMLLLHMLRIANVHICQWLASYLQPTGRPTCCCCCCPGLVCCWRLTPPGDRKCRKGGQHTMVTVCMSVQCDYMVCSPDTCRTW